MFRRLPTSVMHRGLESEPENLGLSMPRFALRPIRESSQWTRHVRPDSAVGPGTQLAVLTGAEKDRQRRSRRTLPPHRLGGVHRRAAPYSARREPQRLTVRHGMPVHIGDGWAGENRLCFASKTLGAHRLAPVRKLDAHYSSPRGPRCGLVGERRVLARRGWAGANGQSFCASCLAVQRRLEPRYP